MKKYSGVLRELAICVVYFVIASAFTYPLIFNMMNMVPGIGHDIFQFFWFAHYDGLALFDKGYELFHTSMLYYPDGVHLNGEPLLFGVVFGLLSKVFNDVVTFNVLYLFLFTFASWSAYRLILYITKTRDTAIFGGLVFGFSPYMLMHGLGHINLICTGFLLLSILFSLKLADSESTDVKLIITSGLIFSLNAFSSYYMLVYFSGWYLAFGVFLWFNKQRTVIFKKLIPALFIMSVLIAPQLISIIKASFSGYYIEVSTLGSSILSSIDLFGFFAPTGLHPLWGDFSAEKFWFVGGGQVERAIFPGFIVIGLTVLGLLKFQKSKWKKWILFWTAGSWILCLGPILQVGGKLTFIPLPGLIVNFLPFIKKRPSILTMVSCIFRWRSHSCYIWTNLAIKKC